MFFFLMYIYIYLSLYLIQSRSNKCLNLSLLILNNMGTSLSSDCGGVSETPYPIQFFLKYSIDWFSFLSLSCFVLKIRDFKDKGIFPK